MKIVMDLRRQDLRQLWRGSGFVKVLTALLVAGLVSIEHVAHAAEAVQLPPFGSRETNTVLVVFASGILSLIVGAVWFKSVNNQSPGTEKMQEVGEAIRAGVATLRPSRTTARRWRRNHSPGESTNGRQ